MTCRGDPGVEEIRERTCSESPANHRGSKCCVTGPQTFGSPHKTLTTLQTCTQARDAELFRDAACKELPSNVSDMATQAHIVSG